MRKITLMVCSLLSLTALLYAQKKLCFEAEELTFVLDKDVFTVQGVYQFSSPEEGVFNIQYPFPSDSIYGKPFDVAVRYFNSGKAIDFRSDRNFKNIYFKSLVNKDTPVFIQYSQSLKAQKAKYILLTTKYWNVPLKRSSFKLVTDTSTVIRSFSYEPEKQIVVGNQKIYFWTKEQFWPQKDFEIEFDRK